MIAIKRLVAIFIFAIGLLLPVGIVAAEEVLDPVCVNNPEATLCVDNNVTQNQQNNSVFGQNGIITKAAKLLSIVVGVAAVIMIIVGGIQYVTSSGDPTNVSNAKNTVLYAIIGLVVALLAQVIIVFILNKL
jgi:hypothetical protein